MPNIRPRVAVVCAYNPQNAGMYSVDLAAQHYFSNKNCIVDFFVTQIERNPLGRAMNQAGLRKLLSVHQRFGTMRFRVLEHIEQLHSYTHLVYWGDFTTNPVYGESEYSARDQRSRFGRYSTSHAEAWKKWKALFALETGKPVGRVVSAGQNFQHDFSSSGPEFHTVFESIGTQFDHILPRDPYSLTNLSRHLPAASACSLEVGLDCAFLLPAAEKRAPLGQFCFHFGRSGFEGTSELIQSIEAQIGLRGVSLENWFRLSPKKADANFSVMRAEIARSQFVLTDTYHVCVNALSMGVPVYALGRCAEDQIGTLGDFKKKELFGMMQAHSCYFECAEGEDEVDFLLRVKADIEQGAALQLAVASKVRETVSFRISAFQSALNAAIFG